MAIQAKGSCDFFNDLCGYRLLRGLIGGGERVITNSINDTGNAVRTSGDELDSLRV